MPASLRSRAEQEERWRVDLGRTFGALAPQALGDGPVDGELAGTSLGDVLTYEVSGSPQIVRRSPAAVRREPSDLLKICVQVRGRATVRQEDREVVLEPGQLAVYDTGRPYALRLEQAWSCAVLAFPRTALALPDVELRSYMQRAHSLSTGPGAVLASFVASVVRQRDSLSPLSARALGDAGLNLAAGAFLDDPSAPRPASADIALRLRIGSYLRRRLADPDLTHASVAAAHNISTRTLNRLFEDQDLTVTELIRQLRLEAVRRDLLDPGQAHRSIAALAARWGFLDQPHFSRLFRAAYGLTPSQVRAGRRQ